ncbi:MAG: DnaB-like helicase N-terminal domain-containing protein [Dermatophilaceae bacterium]
MTDTAYLERALIGALLNEPHSGPDLPELTQRDFTDPLCRALWQVMTSETRWPPGPVNVTDMTAHLTGFDAELHPRLRSAAAVAELQVHAPTRAHPDAYARLIIDETIHREVLALGYQLTQIDPNQPEQAITTIDAINPQLQAHRARSPLGPATPQAEPDSTPAADDAQPNRPATPETTDAGQQYRAEYAVLGAAIHDHPRGSRAHVQACITGNDLTRPDIRAAWSAISQLQTTGWPVDEITVYWQLTHTAVTCRPIPTIAMLRDSRDASTLHHEAIRTVTVASATRVLTRLRTTVTALDADPGQPLAKTIDTITRRTDHVRHQAQRILSTGCHQ